MIVKAFPLIRPSVFSTEFRQIVNADADVLVRPSLLSICAADMRYYLGLRPANILAKKLPMVLIHEAIGTVVKAPSNSDVKVGDYAVLLPCGSNAYLDSNYKLNSFFRSSNADGFCQELLSLDRNEILPISNQNDREPYVFAELLSVCFQSLRRIKEELKISRRIAIWGDGSLGYLMTLVLRNYYPDKEVTVIGKHEDKLEKFNFSSSTETIFNRSNNKYDLMIECVGGNGAQAAIDDMINSSNPKATLLLTGVSEIPPSINTRSILEKGLTLRGTTRSIREDFIHANEFLNSEKVRNFVRVLDSTRCIVTNEVELRSAFESVKSSQFKTTIDFIP